MSRDNHLRSRSRSISRYRNSHYNNASKSNRSPPPDDDYIRMSPPSKSSRSRYQRERSRSIERNGHRSSKRQASPNRVAVTDIRRKNMDPSRVLGVFNLHVRTTESEIRDVFDRFGKIEEIIMVKDSKTRGFRGYCFIYFKHEREATAALNHCNGMELKERMIRVDYSLSARPHSPTPGTYQGKRGRGGSERGRYRDSYRRRSRSRSMDRSARRRTPPRGDDYRDYRSERQERQRNRSPEFERRSRRSPPSRERERERDRSDRHKYR